MKLAKEGKIDIDLYDVKLNQTIVVCETSPTLV